jgi:hypothetical protein
LEKFLDREVVNLGKAVLIEKKIENRNHTTHGVYHDVGQILESFSLHDLCDYLASLGSETSTRYYLEQQIIRGIILKENSNN